MSSDIKEITISPEDVIRFIGRNFFKTALIVSICAALSIVLAFELPKSYKSQAVLSVSSSYFRNPLVSDLISEVYNEGEQAAVRASLFRRALSNDFLDKLGEKYSLFEYPANHRLRALERENFRKRIEYSILTKTNFKVAIEANDPVVAFEMIRSIVEQTIETFVNERYSKLMTTRDAIQSSVDSLRQALEVTDPREIYAEELQSLEGEYQDLVSKYTAQHPAVIKLRTKRQVLKSALAQAEQKAHQTAAREGKEILSATTRGPSQDIYNELLRKLNNLNIVVEMEKNRESISYLGVVEPPSVPLGASFPNKLRFLIGGIFFGFLLAGIRVLADELKRAYAMSGPKVSQTLGVPLLGELPTFIDRSKIRLLDAPSEDSTEDSTQGTTNEQTKSGVDSNEDGLVEDSVGDDRLTPTEHKASG